MINNKNILDIMVHNINMKVTFLKDDVFRVWAEPTGIYEDLTKGKIIEKNEDDYKNDYG